MKTRVFALLTLLGLSLPALAAPTVFWASSPVNPGETVMLFGDGFGADATVTAWPATGPLPATPAAPAALPNSGGQKLEIRVRSTADCLMVGLPSDLPPGVCLLQVSSGGQASAPVYLNRPVIEWWLGDQPEAVSPGAVLRLFGRNLRLLAPGKTLSREEATPDGFAGKVVLVDSAGKEHALALSRADRYTLTVTVPDAAAAGAAKVYVHNGSGGPWGWSEPMSVEVQPPPAWPQTVYNVRDHGARGDGLSDDTLSVRAALQAAGAAGGGVVLLPRGTYKLTGELKVPPRTTVRGEGSDRTILYVPHKTPEFNAVFAGAGDFTIEHLWLTAQTTRRLIVCPDQPGVYRGWGGPLPREDWGRNVHLRDLRLHHLRDAHDVRRADTDLRQELEGPTTVCLCGPYMELTDCDIVSSGHPLLLWNSARSYVVRNVFGTGRGALLIPTCRELCFEGNEIAGRDLETAGSGIGGNEIARVYIADNWFHDIFGANREALTFDTFHCPGPWWVGMVASAEALTVTPAGLDSPWNENRLRGLGCLIIKGKGLGQVRQIVANTGNQLTVDRPWMVPPDGTSAISICPYRTQVTLYRNRSEDASVGIQLWAGGHDFVMDNNLTRRTGGLYGVCRHYRKHSLDIFVPCYFTQWLNNRVEQGFVYEQGPDSTFATLGLIWKGADHPCPGADALTMLANVIRGNDLHDNTRLALTWYGTPFTTSGILDPSSHGEPPGRANLIENNTISDSPLGLDVDSIGKDLLLRNNRVDRCTVPLRDDGQNTWIHPAERLGYQVRGVKQLLGSKANLSAQEQAAAKLAAIPVGAADLAEQWRRCGRS